MNLIINRFVILSPEKMKAFNCNFKEKVNLIVGEKDSGKSTLARSIMYTLGCDVKNLDFISKMPNNIYILDFKIYKDNFVLIRKKLKSGKGKNFFKVIKNEDEIKSFNNTSDFKDYLNEILNIKLVAMNLKNEKTKFYPNHIFLPFYMDQDFSWQDYFTSTFSGLKFIKDHKKHILEYFTGVHPNEFYELKIKKDILSNQKNELTALITSKEMILEENNKNIKIIENIDIEAFKRQYLHYLDIHKNIIEIQHKLKSGLNEKIYKKNSLLEMQKKLEGSINNITSSTHDETCPNCHQKVYHDLEENYKLYLTEQNLIKEKEIIVMNINNLDSEILNEMGKIKNIKGEDYSLKKKLNSDSEVIKLEERAESFAFNNINEKLLNEISISKKNLLGIKSNLEKVEKKLKGLNKNNVAKLYNELMKEAFEKLSIPFEFRSYYDNNLEAVKILLSGTSKAQAFVAQYLTIYEIMVKKTNSVVLPMFVDTFLKEDSNVKDIERTSKYILEVLENKAQSFVFISDNNQTLNAITDYDYNRIDLKGTNDLLNKNYDEVYEEYSQMIRE